jgi:integrase
MASRRPKGSGSVTEVKPGVWRVRVFAGTDPATGHPRQIERTVRGGRKAAESKRDDLAAEVKAGKHAGSAGSMALLFNRWFKQLERSGARQRTIEEYESIIRVHLLPAFGEMQMRAVNVRTVDEYYEAALTSGSQCRTCKGSGRRKVRRKVQPDEPCPTCSGTGKVGLSAQSVKSHANVLTQALGLAASWDWIPNNPAVSAHPPSVSRPKKLTPEVEEVRALLEAAQDDDDLFTAVVLAATTGARRGELCGLQWHDVDWEGATIYIERQRVASRGGVTSTGPTKTGEPRRMSVGPLGLAALRRYSGKIDERARRQGVLRPVPLTAPREWGDRGDWLLSLDSGRTPMRPNTLGNSLSELGRRAGVPVTAHAFRRFAATKMVGAGVDIVTAASRMGHSPAMMLGTYAAFQPKRDVAAAAMLEALVLGPIEAPREP